MKSGAECVRPAFCACCTGRYSETSDLDLFVLMRTEDGYKTCVTVILDGIGMDFYGVKWEWLEEEANYTTPYLAKRKTICTARRQCSAKRSAYLRS